MSATPRPDGLFDTIVGPNSVAETHEQLAAWSEQLAAGDHHVPDRVEQLAEDHARPTKPGDGDGHANDPSKTTTIQRKYAQKLRGRFEDIRSEIRQGVGERDIFDLEARGEDDTDDVGAGVDQLAADRRREFYDLLAEQRYDEARELSRDLVEQLADFDPSDLQTRDYIFQRDADKHEQFMEWLREAQEDGVLEVIDRGENTYIQSSYERGLRNADSWMDVDHDIDVATSVRMPIHEDRLQLLFERNYEALQGITDDVARQISRELADGLAEGVHPDEMARRMADRIDSIGRTRATTLARTEVMHGHNEAALTRYEEILGDVDVEIEAEVSTAGDSHVCDICSPWDGETMSIQEARSNGPPFHPRCRCIARPATSTTEAAGQSGSRPEAGVSSPAS
ncbi:putative head assembly protein [Halobacterium phage ChaoS9]|uniref:Head assembly protein n=1 Tax=Halobacterium phage ChaoS9 TaxID=2847105 RepID=A0A481V764_9CAUD|nr:minor head protein [Halobacterium phage ChaoS9]QBI90012.1 putative head assembly protein [Halobacterium phage ChaoS9]